MSQQNGSFHCHSQIGKCLWSLRNKEEDRKSDIMREREKKRDRAIDGQTDSAIYIIIKSAWR